MSNYYIPGFYCHYNVNIGLLKLMYEEPQMFYEDIKIGAIFDNFPNCIWNGGSLVFGKNFMAKDQIRIMNEFNSLGIPLRLTMTNPLIEEKDCYDRYSNYIMENLNNGFNQVIVASPVLEEYIRINYPEYPIIRSIIAANDENNIYYDDSDKYYMSVLNRKKNNDFEYLNSIKNKNKIEILINETCIPECKKSYEHYKSFAKLQTLKENQEIIDTKCDFDKERKYRYKMAKELPSYISREHIKEIYEPMGFNNFKISGRISYAPIIIDYANYFVKPEWKDDFLAMMLKYYAQDFRISFN